jgi:Holliday junction resolvasome RuvABC endonuclease subunit
MDPSMSNWGLAWGIYDPSDQTLSIKTVDVIKPVTLTGKQVRQNSKDLGRAYDLFTGALAATEGATAVFVEVPVGSQSARAMASYGICCGILGALRASGIPFFEVTPNEVKLATVGKKTASKAEIIQRAVTHHPRANWPMQTKNGVTSPVASKAEHMADAIGAIEAGIELPSFQQLLQFSNVA